MESRSISFFVACLPVAQPRPKVTTFGGHARMYEAGKESPIHAFKAGVRKSWQDAGAKKLEGPLSATLVCVFPRLKSAPKKQPGRIWKDTKPDCDNLAKGVLDALNGLAFSDDALVVQLETLKAFAAVDETPGVAVVLRQLEAIHALLMPAFVLDAPAGLSTPSETPNAPGSV